MHRSPELESGLIRILRQVAWLRGGLIAISVMLYLAFSTERGALSLLIAFTIERVVFIAFVTWDRIRKKLGAAFLPATLVWLIVVPVLELVITILSRNETLRSIGLQADALGLSSPLIWLVVPVVLAAWQYGRRGLQITIAALIVEHAVLGIALLRDTVLGAGFILNSSGRIAMLVILGYVVMRLVEAQKKDRAALEQAHRQLAQRAATVEQLAESRERNRMARELHDILAHSITALSLQVQAASTSIDHDPAESKILLRDAQTTARTSANEVRRAIQSLRATQLQDLGLAQALRELCRAQAERTGAKFDCAIAELSALDPLTEQAVYRIAHETLANVERHAAATQVGVRLEINSERKLRLTIQDDGMGFDPREIPQGHFGLIGMTERAQEVGGEFKVESQPGRGTRIELGIPI